MWFFGQVKNIGICGRLSFHCCCISTNKRTYLIFYFFFFKCQSNIEESLVIVPPMNNMSDYRKSGWRKCFPPTTFIIIDLEALLCQKALNHSTNIIDIQCIIIKSSISMYSNSFYLNSLNGLKGTHPLYKPPRSRTVICIWHTIILMMDTLDNTFMSEDDISCFSSVFLSLLHVNKFFAPNLNSEIKRTCCLYVDKLHAIQCTF